MKLRSLFLALAAGVAALVSCDVIEELADAKISLDQTEIVLPKEGGSATFSILATRDWMISGDLPDWLALSANSGSASAQPQTITITVDENKGNDREASITFTIGFSKAALLVKQPGAAGEIKKGSGTKDDPYTVAGVIAYLETLGADVNSPNKVYVKGKIASIKEEYSAQYGNGNFDITDDGEVGDVKFTCYRVLYLGNQKWTASDTQIKLKDDVVIFGNVVNFKGNTPETQQGNAFLFSLNGVDKGGDEAGQGTGTTAEVKGTGTEADPFNVAAAIAKAQAVGQTASAESYYIKGKVKTVKEQFGAQYGNGTFELVDDGFDAVFTAYRILYFGNQKWVEGNKTVSEGDEIVVVGKVVNFKGNTPETDQGSGYLYSINGEKGDGSTNPPAGDETPTGAGTLESPYNPKAASDVASALDSGSKTENDVYVKGKISSVKYTFSAQYGTATFNISEDGATSGTQFQIYSVYYLGNKPWVDGDAQVAVGDEVIICGKLTNYNGTPETSSKEAYIYSLNGQTSIAQSAVFGVEKTEIKVAASATTAEIKVTGNVAWTVNRKSDQVTCNPTSGEGAGTITVTFPANESTETEVSYSIGIATEADVTNKQLIVNITQGKVGEAGTPDFTSNVSWTAGSNQSYSEKATVNEVADVAVLKLGTSSKAGSSTLTLPEGSTSLTFYAVSWKAKKSKLIFKSGDTEVGSVEPAANDGLANSSPYTLTVTDSDVYTITFSATTTLTVETSGSNTRAALFGVVAK